MSFGVFAWGRTIGLALFIGLAASHAQSAEVAAPLTLGELLSHASQFYPALRAARFEAQAASEDTLSVRRQRWPTLSLTSETQTGNLRSYPTNVMQVQQTLWDFGHTSARIAEAEAASDVSALNVYVQQQELFLQIITAWQNVQAAREKVNVANSTLSRLASYQAQMRRRVEAEVSPRIDLELVDARLLQTQVELITAQTSLQLAVTRLEQLSGLSGLQQRMGDRAALPDLRDTEAFTRSMDMADWHQLAQQGPAVARARAQLRQAQNKLDGKRAEAWPQLYVRTYKPLSAIPSSQDTSTTAFLGLSYTPGAGLSTWAEAQALGTRIASAELSVDAAVLELYQVLLSDREEYLNARHRIRALEKAVEGSELVLASYKRQFEASKKTWLDLLNAVRELAQNQYSQADAQATMEAAMNRLQLRMTDPSYKPTE